MTRVNKAACRCRTAYKEHGMVGLKNVRKYYSSPPLERELSLEEKYERLEAKMKLLETENELLKKMDQPER